MGHKGEVAEQFGIIMKALWTGQYRYINPKDFKITIGKINDQFAGYSQQDSQELLLFLMDGLHEDLKIVIIGRDIKKKIMIISMTLKLQNMLGRNISSSMSLLLLHFFRVSSNSQYSASPVTKSLGHLRPSCIYLYH